MVSTMEANFPIAHARMLAYEGGYSNHPQDPGGPTLEGVTQRVYDAWREENGKARRALTPQMRGRTDWIGERDAIYRANYWAPPRCAVLPGGVEAAVYDYSVNSGIGRARKVLQRVVGVPETGTIDQPTLAAVAKRDAKQLVDAICDERLRFLKSLKTWPVFGEGWEKRVRNVKAYAGALAVNSVVATAPAPSTVPGKGEVPEPKAAKTIAKGSGPGVVVEEAARDGGGWLAWIAAHPLETAVIAAAAVTAVVLIVRAINRWHRTRQEAPMPGTQVVPALAPSPAPPPLAA